MNVRFAVLSRVLPFAAQPVCFIDKSGYGVMMFESLKRLLGDLGEMARHGRPGVRQFDEEDHRVAAAALLVHVADSDGEIRETEQERLRAVVAERFGLDAASAAQLIREALWSEHEAVSVDHFVNILRRALDADGRLRLIAMMWDVVYADGDAGETEDATLWRIAGMLGVNEQDLETIRRSRAPARGPDGDAGADV